MENDKEQNKDGICLVKICILGILIVGCGISFIKAINHPNKVEVTYIIQTDSLGNISTESKMYVDSLMQIAKTWEQNFDDRYEFFLQQRETFQDYITWTSLVVSVVLTMLGFLGYRSLSSMENKIRQQLKGTLYKDVYKDVNDDIRKNIDSYKECLKDIMIEKFEGLKSANSNEISQKVKYEEAKGKEALFKSVEDKAEKLIENYVNQKLNQIDNINKKIQELDGKINIIGQNKMKKKLKDKNSTSESNASVKSTPKSSDYNPNPYNSNKTNK